jgi:hypothetical protein
MGDYRRGLDLSVYLLTSYRSCSQSVTRRFLVTAPAMVILFPPTQVLSSQTPTQQHQVEVKVTLRLTVSQ